MGDIIFSLTPLDVSALGWIHRHLDLKKGNLLRCCLLAMNSEAEEASLIETCKQLNINRFHVELFDNPVDSSGSRFLSTPGSSE